MTRGRSGVIWIARSAGSCLFAVLLIAALALEARPARAQSPVTLSADAQPAAPAPAAPDPGKAKAKEPKPAKAKAPRHVHSPDDGPWDGGALWVTLRAGYNKASYETAGGGSVGYGFGFTRMLGPAWSFGGLAEYNILGQFGNATESEIPFTLELDRHIRVSETFRMYFGFGGGTYYHKFSNTTADLSDVRGGGLICVGGNALVSKHHLFGLDGRMAFVGSKSDVPDSNPVFGHQKSTIMRWSIKAGWSVAY